MKQATWTNIVALTAGAVYGLGATDAKAQTDWVVVNLHPAGADYSIAYAVDGTQQAGVIGDGSAPIVAGLWTGSAASWTSLMPPGGFTSVARGVRAGQQVGNAGFATSSEAGYWNGTASSWTSLHPPGGGTSSFAFATDNGQQVGYVTQNSLGKAALWTGSPASWINLNPPDSFESWAMGVHNGQQVGYTTDNLLTHHAALWTGSAASWVDLNPGGASESDAYAVHNGQQVGRAKMGSLQRASLWTGDAGTWLDLMPPGSSNGEARAVHSGYQAGWIVANGVQRAGIWHGTAASWEELPLPPPPNAWSGPRAAYGIWTDGVTIRVAGYAFSSANNRNEALLWTKTLAQPCTADCDQSGTLTIDDFICFQTLFALGDPNADCDANGQMSIDDFICFQTFFAIGC